MIARLFVILSVSFSLTGSVTVNIFSETPDIIIYEIKPTHELTRTEEQRRLCNRVPCPKAKSKAELASIRIISGLNDIVILSAPIVASGAVYYLHRPNGDARQLKFKENKTKNFSNTYEDLLSNIAKDKRVAASGKFKIFNVNYNTTSFRIDDVFAEEEAKMEPHDFMIGPLQENDHGNWVLSTYYMDSDGLWIELFQVITIEITEIVPLTPEKPQLVLGATFVLSFAYPFSNLETCEIVPPMSTYDRFYERNKVNSDKCEFRIGNVTLDDAGSWIIIGVGRIVYKGSAFLRVQKNLNKA